MKIERCKVNHIENPLGFEMAAPVFSWVVTESSGIRGEEVRLVVGLDEALENCVFDSGKSRELDSMGSRVELLLFPRTRYYWKVTVWADDGDCGESPVCWFETGKLYEPWEAVWVKTPFEKEIHPCIRRDFFVDEEVRAARAYICGLGMYELEINGQKAGDEYLMPGYYDYAKTMRYQTYDVTNLIKVGENGIGAMLGNGWYKGRFGFVPDMEELYGDEMKLLCELHVTTVSGKEIVISTDESWLCCPSPVVESSIYNGEVYDARLAVKGWSEAGNAGKVTEEGTGPDTIWKHVCAAGELSVPLKERLSLPLTIRERLKPREIIHTPAGETVLDFGQEMTGWMEFPCGAPAGSCVFLQYGEILQDGNFYNENLRTAKAEYRYVSDGNDTWVRPHFTYYGFRYVKVEGLTEEELRKSEGCVICSELERTGKITTSSEDINRLFDNALWGQKGNFLDVPTDCPQRDERMGWTGDAQVFAATASFNMDTAAFYHKYLADMVLDQRELGGAVPHVVPDAIGRIHEIQKDQERPFGACAWGDAATVIPWTVYQFFGDKSLLESQFENMKLWTDFIRSQDEKECGGQRLWTCGFHFADWLALDNPDKESRFGGTDCYYVASAYYYYSALLTAKAAEVLGKQKEANEYGTLAEEIKAAFQKKYFTTEGEIKEKTQTAMVMALYLDLVPGGENGKERLVTELKEKLLSNRIHLDTGFVGTPWLCPVLSQNGLKEFAYTLLFNEDFPSWLYEVRMGATTIWERWNSVLPDGKISGTGMNSLNHYAYGSIVEWMYRYMCGINPVEGAPGFKKAVIRPQTDKRLTWVEGRFESPHGTYISRWEREEEKTVYRLQIPFGTEAEFILEDRSKHVLVNEGRSPELENTGRTILKPGSYTITAW